MGNPVVRRVPVALLIVLGRLPHVPIAVLIVLGTARFLEPLVLVTGMVDNQVHEKLHAARVTALNKTINVRNCAVRGVHAVVIRNIVAHVHLWRFVRRRHPDDINPELLDVVQLRHYAGDIADAIVVGVLERRWPDLVDGAFSPPRSVNCFLHMLVCHVLLALFSGVDFVVCL